MYIYYCKHGIKKKSSIETSIHCVFIVFILMRSSFSHIRSIYLSDEETGELFTVEL